MEETDKFENLRCLYQELHSSRKDAEAFQNKVAFAFSTILLILAGLIAKGDYTLAVNPLIKYFISIIIILAVVIGLAYIRTISLTNRERYLMIVRVEQALGFHTSNLYITEDQVSSFDKEPYEESSVLPIRSRQWGERETQYSYSAFVWVNMFAVGLSGIVAIVAVYFA